MLLCISMGAIFRLLWIWRNEQPSTHYFRDYWDILVFLSDSLNHFQSLCIFWVFWVILVCLIVIGTFWSFQILCTRRSFFNSAGVILLIRYFFSDSTNFLRRLLMFSTSRDKFNNFNWCWGIWLSGGCYSTLE